MPQPIHNWSKTVQNQLITQQMNYDQKSESSLAENQILLLNDDQQNAFHCIWDSITNEKGKVFVLQGQGGTGKTYLYEVICHAIHAQGHIILCITSTGLACLLLPGEQTAHSMFKIPIDSLDIDSVCNIPKESLRADLL